MASNDRRMAVEDDESDSSAGATSSGEESESDSSELSSARDDSSTSSDDETLTDLNKFPRIYRKGVIWNRYKPIKQDTLYSKILTHTGDTRSIVHELCSLFDLNSQKAVASLLQLCMDVCGFQKFDITDLYMLEKDVEKALIQFVKELFDDREYLESACYTTEKYLLMEERGILAKYLKLGVYTFLQDLLLMAHKNGILLTKLLDFFDFISYMAVHTLRVISHTGIVFCGKIMSGLVKLWSMPGNDEDTTRQIFDLIQMMYASFMKSLNFDRKSYGARVESCREICTWGKYLPQQVIGEWDILHYIAKYIHDPSQKVRFAALKTVQKLLKNQDTLQYFLKADMETHTRKLVDRIAGRFNDVDDKVVIEAIRTFAILQEVSGERYLSLHRVEELIELIFKMHFVIGQAACGFIYRYFSRFEEGACDKLLYSMALVASRHSCGMELLVEGCLQVVPEIRNWSLYINILSEKRTTVELKTIARLFTEAVTQVLKGCSSKLRIGSPKVDVDPAEHNRVAQHFPQLLSLISDFWEDEAMLTEIFKIFSVVTPTAHHEKEYELLSISIDQLFAAALDRELLKQLISTLKNLCDNINFSDKGKLIKKTLVEKFSEEFCEFLQEPDEENSLIVYKATVLYMDDKLTDEVTWPLLFNAATIFEGEVLTDLLICCKWYLIRALKVLRETKANVTVAHQHGYDLWDSIKEYTALLFSLLRDLEDLTLRLKVYYCLCEFYTCWNDTLRPLIRFDKKYEMLLLTREPKMETILVPFLDKYIINNAEMPLRDRRSGIIAYIEMVSNGTIVLESLVNVYKYYEQYSVDYGQIIEANLTALWELDEKHAFYLVIIATISTVYHNIIEKHGVIDMNMGEAKALKALTKKILTTEPFRKPNKDFIKLVMASIRYSLKASKNLSFLFFARYFLDLITENTELEYMLKELSSKVPTDQQESDAVMCFIKHAKAMKLNDDPRTTDDRDSTEVRQRKGIRLASTSFASPGRPIKESTPKTPSLKKGNAKGASKTSKDTPAVRKQRVPKETPKSRPKGRTSRPLYSKSSEGEIDIQDDSDSNPEQN